jgi:phosphomannomutase
LRGTQRGSLETFTPLERYVPFLCERIRFDLLKSRPLKILYDPMYGAGQDYLDRILADQAGYAPDMLHQGTDPYFGGRIPEPKGEWLPELMQAVPQKGYDLGLANDGDADRFGVVDEQGRFLSANEILPLLLRYLYQHRGYRGSVVRTVATSTLLDCVAAHYGVTVHETPVGFKYVGELMRQEPVIVGGEESGGLSILGHIPEKDGILADLLIAEMVAVEGKPISRIYEEMVREVGLQLHQMSINLHQPEPVKQAVMGQLRNLSPGDTFGGRKIRRIDARDGFKLVFDTYDWVLVRASGTEPILRLYGESPQKEQLEEMRKAVETLMHNPTPVAQVP